MRKTFSALAFGAFMLAAGAAQAQGLPQGCNSPSEIARFLASEFSESPAALGIQQDGTLLQIFASTKGETWTVVLTTPTGMSCIVAEGTRLEIVAPKPEGPAA